MYQKGERSGLNGVTKHLKLIMDIMSGLSEKDRKEVVEKLLNTFQQGKQTKRESHLLTELQKLCRQSKMNEEKALCCPLCGSVSVVKNGHKDGRQRFKCKDCGKTFGDTYGTLFYCSKLPQDKWFKLLDYIIINCPIRRTALDCEINKNTAWLNRQKVCSALKAHANSDSHFTTIAKGDEWYCTLSFKGLHDKEFFINTLGRMPRHSRSVEEKIEYLKDVEITSEKYESIKDTDRPIAYQANIMNQLTADEKRKRGISNDLICVLSCIDRTKDTLLTPECVGRLMEKHISEGFGDKIAEDAVLVTDSHHAYKEFAASHRVNLEQIPTKRHKKGAFSLAHINSYHARLSNYYRTFGSVASKYLNNYLALFQWHDNFRDKSTEENRRLLLNQLCGGAEKPLRRKDCGRTILPFDVKNRFSNAV